MEVIGEVNVRACLLAVAREVTYRDRVLRQFLFRRRLILGVAAVMAVATLVVVVSYRNSKAAVDSGRLVERTHRTISLLEETMALMKSIREARKAGGTITEEQKAQLKSFRDDRKAKMQGVHEQIMAVLTPDQKTQLEAKKAEGMKRREEFRQKRKEMREKRKAAGETTPAQIS